MTNLELGKVTCLVVHLDFKSVDFEKLGSLLRLLVGISNRSRRGMQVFDELGVASDNVMVCTVWGAYF